MSQKEIKASINSAQFRILDSMLDGVRLINKYRTIIHTNHSLEEKIMAHTIGKKCYEGIGKFKECKNCGAEKVFEKGETVTTFEEINGRSYMLICSPVYDKYNIITAIVEVFRDITKEKELENSILEKNQKMREDIEFAQKMQMNMLPLKGVYNDLKIDYYYKPSELLSGDMFDVFRIDNECIGFYICDVVGHGISSSMISMYVKQTVKAISKKTRDLNDIMSELHRTFIALNFDDDKYFSIFFCKYNKTNMELEYVNAGHNCVPLFKRENEVSMLMAKGYPICNIFDSVSYDIGKLQLKSGDNILFYTDGITEMKNQMKEFFGEERLFSVFEKSQEIVEAIDYEIKKFGGYESDDLALLDIKVI
jgi:sigma-B regulation protein RsbU (phosphoserine phosphatase)